MINITDLGTDRQSAHPNGTPRYYEDPNTEDIIGVAGEQCFAKRYGLEIDDKIRPEGDGHVDFEIEWDNKRITFDIKTANKAYNLLVKSWEIEVAADVLILAEYNDGNVIFLGWTTRRKMSWQPKKIFSSLGIVNYYLHRSELNSMERLDSFFMKNKNEIRQIMAD